MVTLCMCVGSGMVRRVTPPKQRKPNVKVLRDEGMTPAQTTRKQAQGWCRRRGEGGQRPEVSRPQGPEAVYNVRMASPENNGNH